MSTLLNNLAFTDAFAALGEQFSIPQSPTPLPEPYLVAISPSSLQLCGISPEQTSSTEFVEIFTGNRLPTHCQPRSTVYSGHQFGIWAGQLGDGRAILLGELNGYEVQLKGSGLTPFSRMGDGRAVLRSSIREFLCSEAMLGLGIPTTRALCVTGSDSLVLREQPETAAVTTRLAPSFIRFGSFEHWFYRQDLTSLTKLADFVLERYYPALLTSPHPYAALLKEVTKRTAHLIAYWQTVGFMHGVMNTDNMSILGLTLDYGPFGFMEAFDPNHICNHSDVGGRYSYARQPSVGEWNCYALGQAMLPLIGSVEETKAALADFEMEYQTKLVALWRAKLGLTCTMEGDDELINTMLKMMYTNRLDFTIFFRRLSHLGVQDTSMDNQLRDLCIDRAAFDQWLAQYRQRLMKESSNDQVRQTAMRRCNPKFVLRNYLAQIAIEAAQRKDFSEIEKLRQILSRPFDEQPEHQSYANLPPDWGRSLEVSCSS
jgi:serine/tyrosine/threonine adenylyltransferase